MNFKSIARPFGLVILAIHPGIRLRFCIIHHRLPQVAKLFTKFRRKQNNTLEIYHSEDTEKRTKN